MYVRTFMAVSFVNVMSGVLNDLRYERTYIHIYILSKAYIHMLCPCHARCIN